MKESRTLAPRTESEPSGLVRNFEPQVVQTGGYPGYRDSAPAEGFQLMEYWRAIRKRLWLVIGLAILVTTVVAIYMAQKPNVYQAKARIQVDLEQTNPDLITSDMQRAASNPDPAYINTQLQLLSSDGLLRRTIKDHSLDTSPQLQSSINQVSFTQRMLRAIGLAGSTENTATKQTIADSSLASSEEIADAIRLAPYVEIVKKSLVIDPVRESRATFKDTRLIDVTYSNTDAVFAAEVVNNLAETFVNTNSEKRSGTNRKTNDYLQQRIADLQTEVKNDELKLQAAKSEAGILKTDGEQTLVLDRLSGLNKDLLEAENIRKLAEAKYNSVLKNPENAKSITEDQIRRYTTEQENSLRTVRNNTQKAIAELKVERAKLLVEFKEGALEVREKDDQIKVLEDHINTEAARYQKELNEFRTRSTQVLLDTLRTEYQQAREREGKVRSAYDEQYNLAQSQNAGAVQIRLLEQNIETNRGFLENLRKQQSGNDVAAQGTDNNISIADPAIPDNTAVSPRRLTTVMIALVLSTIFGMGLALFLEYLDDTINSTSDVETYLQLPALAAIPTMDTIPRRRLLLVGSGQELAEERAKSELLIDSDSRSSLSEVYRQLRTSILLSTAGHAPKSLLVTSSLPSEGKTTTASNTAISLAQTGARVLIIDADMRRPRVHAVFGVENGEGLSSTLSSSFDEEEILKVIKFDPRTGVHILTSGPIPPNPAELIGSDQMTKVIELFKNNFDHVVVDSPPITSFTDGVLVASIVDGVILVVSAGNSSRQVVRRARQILNDIGARIFGVVLNNVNLKANDNYYYQSYYHRDSYDSPDRK